MDDKWFVVKQNNLCGPAYLEGTPKLVYVQAPTLSEALSLVLAEFHLQDDYCEECGSRWSVFSVDSNFLNNQSIWGLFESSFRREEDFTPWFWPNTQTKPTPLRRQEPYESPAHLWLEKQNLPQKEKCLDVLDFLFSMKDEVLCIPTPDIEISPCEEEPLVCLSWINMNVYLVFDIDTAGKVEVFFQEVVNPNVCVNKTLSLLEEEKPLLRSFFQHFLLYS